MASVQVIARDDKRTLCVEWDHGQRIFYFKELDGSRTPLSEDQAYDGLYALRNGNGTYEHWQLADDDIDGLLDRLFENREKQSFGEEVAIEWCRYKPAARLYEVEKFLQEDANLVAFGLAFRETIRLQWQRQRLDYVTSHAPRLIDPLLNGEMSLNVAYESAIAQRREAGKSCVSDLDDDIPF